MASVSGSCSHTQKGRNLGVSHLVLVSAGHQEVSHVVCAVYKTVAFNGFPSQSSIRKENSSLFTVWEEIMGEGKTPPLLSPHRLWTGNYLEKSLNLLEGIHGSPLSSWKKCACSCQCWAVWQHATKSAFSCFRGMWSKEESRVSVGELLMGWETDCCSFSPSFWRPSRKMLLFPSLSWGFALLLYLHSKLSFFRCATLSDPSGLCMSLQEGVTHSFHLQLGDKRTNAALQQPKASPAVFFHP